MSSLEKQVLRVISQRREGCTQSQILAGLSKKPSVQKMAATLNALTSNHRIKLSQTPNGEVLYQKMTESAARALKGLNSDQELVYRVVESVGREGIWSRDLKAKTNLERTFIKITGQLEKKGLIKPFKSVGSKYRKYYILSDLEPAEHHIGGIWYDEQMRFDHEFVDTHMKIVLGIVKENDLSSVSDVRQKLSQLDISTVTLSEKDVRKLLYGLLYDGLVIMTEDGEFRSTSLSISDVPQTGLTQTPCGSCPVSSLCGKTPAITPQKCIYLTEWIARQYISELNPFRL